MSIKSGVKSIKVKKKIIIISVIIIAIVGMSISSYAKAQKAKIKQVTTAKVTKKKVIQTVSATGNVEARYRNEIALNPSQKVVKVLVTEGQQVKKGDVLVQLDTADYQNQLEKAKLNLANAQITLNELIRTGVSTDRSTAESSVTQAQIALDTAQRNYDDLNKKFQQSQALLSGGYISQSDYDASKKAVDDAANGVKNSQVALTNSQSSLNNVNSNSNDKIANQKNLAALAQADVDNLNKKIEDCNIKANTDGVVIKMDAKENQFPATGDTIIVDDDSLFKVSIDMNQYDAIKVAKGQKAEIQLKGSNKKYTGTVTDIGEMAQIKQNSTDEDYKVNIKITMDNPDENVKAGYEADVVVTLNQKDDVLAIGFDGIKEDKASGKKYVYIVDNNSKASKKYIKTGIETDYDVEVTDGLKVGDKYIINPPETLHEGDKVAEAAGKNGGSKK